MKAPYVSAMTDRFRTYQATRCLNCEAQLEATDRYCYCCGQENRKFKRAALDYLREGFSNFLQLEGKTWNTLKDLYIPGRITVNYLNGKRQRYLHPLRLVLLSSIIFFGIISIVGDDTSVIQTGSSAEDVEKLEKNNVGSGSFSQGLKDGLSASDYGDKHPLENRMSQIDQLRAHYIAHDQLHQLRDSLNAKGFIKTSEGKFLADTLLALFPEPSNDFDISLFGDSINIDSRLLVSESPEVIAAQSGAEKPIILFMLRKILSMYQSGVETVNEYLFKNLSWVLLLFIPLMAFGYWAIYHRRMPYYAQNLSFTAISASALLLAASVFLLLNLILPSAFVLPLGILTSYGFLVLTESKAYDYKLWKTILKNLVVLVFAMLMLPIAFFLWLLVAFILL